MSSGLVLAARPVRKGTHAELLRRNAALVEAQSYRPVEFVTWENDLPMVGPKYGPNAEARNRFLEQHLNGIHEWVFWVDADLVAMPANLLATLVWYAETYDAIVAPMVRVEKLDPDREISFDNGGWFYDTGAFIQRNGRPVQVDGRLETDGPIAEMDSVGTCYVAPARLYRQGLRYHAEGTTVEHVAFCAAARGQGVRVMALTEWEVEHAYLPKYGERWHS